MALRMRPQGTYIDCTFGRGGHARAILESLDSSGRLLAVDQDPEARFAARDQFSSDSRFSFYSGSFVVLLRLAQDLDLAGAVDGVLLDLGVSSPQLDDPERGFSFLRDGPLDMRMDRNRGPTATDWLAHAEETEIDSVLKAFGEERYHRRIALALVTARKERPITTTGQLAAIIANAVPGREVGKHPATRSFQAIRIHLNQELSALQTVLPQCVEVLAPGGRLVVISFHSLEDRIVKRFLRDQARPKLPPPSVPITVNQQVRPKLRLIGKTTRAGCAEIAHNPRARSAVMRVGERCQ